MSVWAVAPTSAQDGSETFADNAAARKTLQVTQPSGAFDDDEGAYYEAPFDALAERGILAGTECAQRQICPGEPIRRSTMAVWLGRALTDTEPVDTGASRFADVDAGHWTAPHIERFAQLGITAGCATGPLRYCPDRAVTRSQMAAFLVRAFELDDAASAGFADTAGHLFEADIDKLAAARITVGCASDPPRYCPDRHVSRGQMATFIAQALNLTPVVADDGADGPGGDGQQTVSAFPPGYQFQSVTAGDRHTCALYGQWAGSSIICWGDDSDGKLDAPDGRFTAIAAGHDHTCALRAEGTIACWGANDAEQATPPRQSSGFRRDQFAAGYKHTCVRRGSDLVCWGGGGASRRYESLPFTFRGLSGGREHYCGLTDEDKILCVGDNRFGQLDAPSGAYGFIEAGSRHNCASAVSSGDVVCWGDNQHGQTDVPPLGPNQSFSHRGVAAGAAHSCAFLTGAISAGAITCWGSNSHGQLRAPTDLDIYWAITAGSRHTCAIRSGGHAIVCWGDNRSGQADAPALPPATTGPPTLDETDDDNDDGRSGEFTTLTAGLTPAAPRAPDPSEFDTTIDAPGGPFAQVLAGNYGSVCGLRVDGSLDCWWDNGELLDTLPSGRFSAFDASGPFGCAIRQLDGSLACWGRDELRDNSPTGSFSQVAVSFTGDVACAIRTNGQLACWDGNPFGRLSDVVDPATQGGDGRYSASANYVDVSVSDQNACAVRADGTLDCWGWLIWGSRQLPSHPQGLQSVSVGRDGSICGLTRGGTVVCISHDLPPPVNGRRPPPQWQNGPAGSYRSVTVGVGHACAVAADGAARCWQVEADPRYSSYPLRTWGSHPESFTPPSGRFQTVAASRDSTRPQTCGVRTDGSITCWGRRGSASIALGSSVVSVASGEDFICGLLRDRTISCWGANWFGQLDAPSGGFLQMAAGYWHACAIRDDKTVGCWGYNEHGQADAPAGTFDQVVAAGSYSCGLRTDATVTCWGSNFSHALDTPGGSFTKIAVSRGEGGRVSDLGTTCGLRPNGRVVCWGGTTTAGTVSGIGAGLAQASAATPYADFDLSPGYWCAVRTDGIVECDGFSCGSGFFAPAPRHQCYTDERNRVVCQAGPDDPFAEVLITRFGACGSTGEGQWTCFGEGVHRVWPAGGAHDVSPPGSIGCAKRPDGTWTCNGALRPAVWDPFDPQTITFS